MQQSLEKRIIALESAGTRVYRWVWRNAGETDAEAVARAGINQIENVLIFSWRD